MNHYSAEQKAALMAKMLPPHNLSAAQIARQAGIPVGTLYTWRAKAKQSGQPMPAKPSSPECWSAQKKLNTIIETAALNESELSQYCRERGLYPDQVKRWKQESLLGFKHQAEQVKQDRQQAKADRARIKQLKRELRHKEKALAETAALLVLRKKLNALWESDGEER